MKKVHETDDKEEKKNVWKNKERSVYEREDEEEKKNLWKK